MNVFCLFSVDTYHGFLYMQEGNYISRLIFDLNDNLAGIQTAVSSILLTLRKPCLTRNFHKILREILGAYMKTESKFAINVLRQVISLCGNNLNYLASKLKWFGWTSSNNLMFKTIVSLACVTAQFSWLSMNCLHDIRIWQTHKSLVTYLRFNETLPSVSTFFLSVVYSRCMASIILR